MRHCLQNTRIMTGGGGLNVEIVKWSCLHKIKIVKKGP